MGVSMADQMFPQVLETLRTSRMEEMQVPSSLEGLFEEVTCHRTHPHHRHQFDQVLLPVLPIADSLVQVYRPLLPTNLRSTLIGLGTCQPFRQVHHLSHLVAQAVRL